MNVYFHLCGVAGLSEESRIEFTGEMDGLATLILHDVEYKIVSRGFWQYHHYWCKIVKYLDGVRGVWFFDDHKDNGPAQLLGQDLSLISGMQASTSWLIYSCKPSAVKQKVIDSGISKIPAKNPDAQGDLPFISAQDLEGEEDQLDEAFPDIKGILETVQEESPRTHTSVPVHKAKDAFSSAIPPEDKPPKAESLTTVPTLGPHPPSQGEKAKEAFNRVSFSSSAPVKKTRVDVEDSVQVPATLPNKPKPQSAEALKGPLSVCLRINKRQAESSPVKSPSAPPCKEVKSAQKASRPKKNAKAKAMEVKENLPVPVEDVDKKVKVKATARAKGRKK
ncbi:uncharacterized protein MELLADRAFT_107477 [Melampsora larici-populina 98AG31]|uniref:Uncharacterized protein n=1 Tax=Melampsora larici-populina (strain 98AG31 / pathotype 3-4-7) TaxID=747676 RepID=F4RPY2_MELLP|nr:uncharacterized protein MELLADRAFT_107477 [Melampsora larici-populina 98AG31]EGG05656.1 hypothetical protein MELLADRAFT_107477 [Melampsora larici-populina 98AG31]